MTHEEASEARRLSREEFDQLSDAQLAEGYLQSAGTILIVLGWQMGEIPGPIAAMLLTDGDETRLAEMRDGLVAGAALVCLERLVNGGEPVGLRDASPLAPLITMMGQASEHERPDDDPDADTSLLV